jgi:hypothetical protein
MKCWDLALLHFWPSVKIFTSCEQMERLQCREHKTGRLQIFAGTKQANEGNHLNQRTRSERRPSFYTASSVAEASRSAKCCLIRSLRAILLFSGLIALLVVALLVGAVCVWFL